MKTAKEVVAPLDNQPTENSTAIDFDIFQDSQTVTDSLRNEHSLEKANQWAAQHRSKLRRSGSMFEADLHKKRFVDLILEGKRIEAINYVRENVSNSKYFNDVWQQDLKKVTCF